MATGMFHIFNGTTGMDDVYGGVMNDTLRGGGGNDTIYGAAGNDLLDGGTGNDSIGGGDDQDTVTGGGGNDLLFGDFGNDRLDGGADNDLMFGGEGNDTVLGNSGNDTLDGGEGSLAPFGHITDTQTDTLDGGSGNDVLVYDSHDFFDGMGMALGMHGSYQGGSGTDTLQIGGMQVGANLMELGGLTVDFTDIDNSAIMNIERLDLLDNVTVADDEGFPHDESGADMGGSGDSDGISADGFGMAADDVGGNPAGSTVILNKADVLALNVTHTLIIDGTSLDTVDLHTVPGEFTHMGSATINGHGYEKYVAGAGSGTATVLVDQDIGNANVILV